MAEPAGQQPGNLMDPLSVRNSDTGHMKRMAAEGANTNNQARKTIKLKPLAVKKPGISASDLGAQAAPAAAAPSPTGTAPSIHLEQPVHVAAPAAASTPAALSGVPVSNKAATVTIPTSTPAAVGEQATVAMEKLDASADQQTQKLQKISPTPSATPEHMAPHASSVAPGALPGSKQTIKLRPSTSVSNAEAATTDLPRPASAQTIKLSPKSAEGEINTTADTLKEVPTVAMARQTIRLVPKKSDAASAVSVAAPAKPKPSDPTINLQDRVAVEETAQTLPRPSDPTTKLTPTQMMHAPAPEATAKAISTPEHRAEVHQAQPAPAIVPPPSAVAAQPVEEPHKKIGIKLHTGSHAAAEATPHPELAKPGHSHTASAVSVADEEPVVEQEVAKAKDEPSILFTIAAAVALLTIGFLSFVLFVQFDNHWWGGNMKVPGLVSLVK